MKELIFKDDIYKMNWIEGETEWGTVKCSDGISVKTESERSGDIITERYIFTNTTDKYIFTDLDSISIYTPFNDDYTDSKTCITNRCHTHLFCGNDISYVMALRMGGEAPHLGLVLTRGSIGGYSVERDTRRMSNDRGDFILHPSPQVMAPGCSFEIEWKLFSHCGKIDFYDRAKKLCDRFIDVKAHRYTVFGDEKIKISIEPVFDFETGDVNITCNGKTVAHKMTDKKIFIEENAERYGIARYDIDICGVKTFCNIYCLPSAEELAEKRCMFIAEKQQFNDPGSMLCGAYLAYDNEEGHIHYSSQYDRNGGRERVGMAQLVAEYLKDHRNDKLEESLKKYVEYIERELVDVNTGEVFNDCGRDDSYERLYNYPWYSLFYLNLYDLHGDIYFLNVALNILKEFYNRGGARFYAIKIPARLICEALEKENMIDELDEIKKHFIEHCAYIMENGLCSPAHEVNYEQSITAPAAELLLQMYFITGEKVYLKGAEKQLAALELFNGLQPDCRLYETAIRHWDGYWFGKRRMYGDTFPHYWSALTAEVYALYGEAVNSDEYREKAEHAYRGVMPLFMADGTASCAYVFPHRVNGARAGFYDEYANDQDWALYFMLKHIKG